MTLAACRITDGQPLTERAALSPFARDKVTNRAVSTNHSLFEEKGKRKRNRAEYGPSAYQRLL